MSELKSPNENLPMDGDTPKDGTDKAVPNLLHDPRVRHGVYRDRFIDAVPANQRRDPECMDISDEESDNGLRNVAAPVPVRQPLPRASNVTFNASESQFGRNMLRNSRLNNHSGAIRTTFPNLVMDDELFGIFIPALPSSETLLPRSLVTNPPNVLSRIQNSSGLLPPPPPPPINLQQSPQNPAARVPLPSFIPAPMGHHSTVRSSVDTLPSSSKVGPSASRASTDVIPSNTTAPNNSQFMSPTELQQQHESNASLTNENYYESTLLQSGSFLEAARHHYDNRVFHKLYNDYKKMNNSKENDKNVKTNVLKGLKHLICDRDTLRDELTKREREMANMGVQLKNQESTIKGLKELKENADIKAKKAEEEKEELKKEVKNSKQLLEAKMVHESVQKQNLEKTKEKNERLLDENDTLKKAIENSKKSYEQEIQKLKDQIKAEQDEKNVLKEEMKKTEDKAIKDAQEIKKYRAKKKESETENNRLKLELEAVKRENQKKDEQIMRMEKDQKLLAQSNKDLIEKVNEADQKLKELQDRLSDAAKEKAEAKKEGKAEAEAAVKPTLDKFNQHKKALKSLFRDVKIAEILSKKRKRREFAAVRTDTVSDAGPSSAKKPRIDNASETSNVRPRSNPPVAIISSNPISNAQPARANSATSRDGAADASLFANNGINSLMQQMGSNTPPVPLNNVPFASSSMNIPQFNHSGVPVTQYRPRYAFMQHQVDQRPQYQYAPHHHQQNRPQMQNVVQTSDIQSPLQLLEASATKIFHSNFHVTHENAENVFQSLPEDSRNILRKYAQEVMKTSNSHANPMIQMIIRQIQIQRQQLQWQQQQYNFVRLQQQQPPPPQFVNDRRQSATRTINSGSFSNSRSSRNRTVEVPRSSQCQPNQSIMPQRWEHPFPQLGCTSFQPPPQQNPPRQQQNPPTQNHQPQPQPVQNPVANPNRPIIPSTAIVSHSTPVLVQALNSSNVNNVENEVQRLIEICHPSRRELNGYVRLRRFNIPIIDESFYYTPNDLDLTFRESNRNFVRR
uniref:Uncharacterized protein n=1 Tax=Panagrolaimus superbus TaxID=310955 RepID=A0A914Y474_9BILA